MGNEIYSYSQDTCSAKLNKLSAGRLDAVDKRAFYQRSAPRSIMTVLGTHELKLNSVVNVRDLDESIPMSCGTAIL